MALVIAELESKFTGNDSDVQAAGARTLALYERLKAAGSQVNTLSPALKDASGDLQKVQAQATEAVAALSKTQPAITGIAGMGSAVDSLQTKLSTLTGRPHTAEVAVKISSAQATLKELQADLTRLKGQPATVEIRANVTQVREQIAQVRREVQQLQQESTKGGTAGVAGNLIGNIAALGVATIGFRALGGAVEGTLGIAANFESEMSAVQATTHASATDMAALQQEALRLGAATDVGAVSAQDAANAIFELSKAGLSTSQILAGAATATLQMSAAAGPEFGVANSATLAANAMNTFRRENLSAVTVANTFVGAANASTASLSSLQLGFGAVGSVAATVGLSFTDTATALALFANKGLQGSDAGTSLKTMLLNLQPQTDKQKALFDQLGITTRGMGNQFFDAQGHIKSMADIAGVLQEALSGMSEQQRLAATNTLFGSDAIRAASILYSEGATGVQTLAGQMREQGNAADAAGVMNNNAKGKFDALQGTLQTLAITAGTQATGALGKLADALNRLAASKGAQTAATSAGDALAGLTTNASAGVDVLADLGGSFEKLNAVLAVSANNMAVSLGLTSQAEADAANATTMATAQQALATQNSTATMLDAHAIYAQQVVNHMVQTGNDLTDVAVETGANQVTAVTNALGDIQNYYTSWGSGMVSIAGGTGDDVGTSLGQTFYNTVVKWVNDGMAMVNRQLANQRAMITAATNEYAALYQAGAKNPEWREVEHQKAQAGIAAQGQRERDAQEATREAKAAAAAGRRETAHAASLARQSAAEVKHADTVAAQADRAQQSVVQALGQAASQSESSAKGISESLLTLFNSLDDAAKAKMGGVQEAITGLLAQAASATPPTVQQIHDTVVDQLTKMAQSGTQEVRLLAQNALDHLETLATGAAATATKTQEKLTSETLKAQQNVVGNFQKMAEESASPTGQMSNIILTLMDTLKEQGTAKIAGLTDNIQGLLDQMLSDSPPTMDAVRTSVGDIIDQMAASSDVRVREMALSAKAAFTAYQQAATDALAKTNADAAAQLLQLQQTLVGGLGTAVQGMQTEAQNIPAFLQQALAVAKTAAEAGMGGVADTLTSQIQRAAAGDTAALGSLNSTLLDALRRMTQSTDTQTALMAQAALVHFDQMAQDAADKTAQMAADTAANLVKTQQAVVQGLEGAVTATGDKSKSILDIILALGPMATQATEAGMPGVAAAIIKWMDAAKNGTLPSAQEIRDTIARLLGEAQQAGDASLGLFAQQAQEHLAAAAAAAQNVAAIKAAVTELGTAITNAEHTLTPFQTALDGTKTGLEAATAAVKAAKDEVAGYQSDLRDAQQALKDFTSTPLEGEGASKEAQFANQQQQNALQYQINQMKLGGASADALKPYEKQLEQLRLQSEQLRLQAALTFDPMRHSLEALNPQAKELTFQEAQEGALRAKTQISAFQQALIAANKHVAGAEAAQRGAQQAVEAATLAYKDQETAVKALVEQLKAQQTAIQNGTPAPGAPGTAQATGQSTAQGVGDGLQAAAAATAQTAATAAQGLLTAMRTALGISGPGAPATTTAAMGTALGTALGTGTQTGLAGVPAAVSAGLAATTQAFQTGLQGLIPVWDSLFGPDAGQEGTLLNRLWGHQATSFWSVLGAYTVQRLDIWFSGANGWQQNLDLLATRLTDYLRVKAGEVAVGGGEIGKQIAAGIAAGLIAGTPAVEAAAAEAVRKAIQAAREAGMIKSPSQAAAALVGAPLAQGVAQGIVGATGGALESMRTLVAQVLGAGAVGAASPLAPQNGPRSRAFAPGPGGGQTGGLDPPPGAGLPPLPPLLPLPPAGGPLTGAQAPGNIYITLNVEGLQGNIADPLSWDRAVSAISIAMQRRGLLRSNGVVV